MGHLRRKSYGECNSNAAHSAQHALSTPVPASSAAAAQPID
jgi:hypothetical protein